MLKAIKEFLSAKNNTLALAIALILCFLLIIVAFVVPNDFKEVTACYDSTPMRACYSISESICQTTWQNYAEVCATKLRQSSVKINPSALIGPRIQKCQKVNYDKIFRYARKNLSNELCMSHFKYIDEHQWEVLKQ